MRICFITSLFGNMGDQPCHFQKINNVDYFLFTDQRPENFSTSWDVRNIENLPEIVNLNCNIRRSRYPKFMAKSLLTKFNKYYDYIFYCDAFFSPNATSDWTKLCETISSQRFGLTQTSHRSEKVRKRGIRQECIDIVLQKRDSKVSINKTLAILQQLNPEVNLEAPQYYENTMFGFDTSNDLVTQFMQRFWQIYTEYAVTYRDQPLWNFLLLDFDLKPLCVEKLNPLSMYDTHTDCMNGDQSEFYFNVTGKYGKHQYVSD